VSVSILKGVIVKSELLPRFSSANIKRLVWQWSWSLAAT